MISSWRRLRRHDLASLRAAVWALRALRTARSQLRRGSFEAVRVPAPPRVPESAGRGVNAVLRRLPHTCLERSLVWQRWIATFRPAPDVVVGVSGPSGGFHAHAWLDGEPDVEDDFHELLRLPSGSH